MKKVTFLNGLENVTINANENDVLIESFENNNIKLPHGCLAGSCGACRIEVIEGELSPPSSVENDTVSFLKNNLANRTGDKSYLQKNIRLSCRAKIKTDLTFTILK